MFVYCPQLCPAWGGAGVSWLRTDFLPQSNQPHPKAPATPSPLSSPGWLTTPQLRERGKGTAILFHVHGWSWEAWLGETRNEFSWRRSPPFHILCLSHFIFVLKVSPCLYSVIPKPVSLALTSFRSSTPTNCQMSYRPHELNLSRTGSCLLTGPLLSEKQ